jgi:protein SCO1/2
MENTRNDKNTKRNIRLIVIGVLVFSAVTIAALANKLSQPRILNKYELRDYGALLLDEPQPLLDFALLDQDGEIFNRQRLQGRWTVFFFGFTHCGDICPATMSVLAKTYAELKAPVKTDFQVVFVTVDPDRDTGPVLKDYTTRFNADFVGLTGAMPDLINFASQMKVPYRPVLEGQESSSDTQQEPQHSANLVVVNPKGELHGFFRPPFAHGGLRVVWRSLRAGHAD